MRKLFLLCILMNMTLHVTAQNAPLSLDDLIPGGKSYARFDPKNLAQLQWLGNSVIQARKNSFTIYELGKIKKDSLVLTLDMINKALQKRGIDELKKLPTVQTYGKENLTFYFTHNDNHIGYNTEMNNIESLLPLTKEDKNIDFDPTKKQLVSTVKNALYWTGETGKRRCIAQDTNPAISFGAQDVHRNEFGISKGTFWSPNGNAIAFYRMDESQVGDYPLVNISARQASLQTIKYPMAGTKSHIVTVGIYFPEKNKTIYLKSGTPKERYFTNITWAPDEKTVYIQELNRRQDTCCLNAYDAKTGKLVKTLFTETSDKYVEPQAPILFLPENSEQFVYQSFRDGHNHLYLYSTTGELLKQITQGDWSVTNIVGFDKIGEHIHILSTEDSPLERNGYQVSLQDGQSKRITATNGTHTLQQNPAGSHVINRFSNAQTPREIVITEISSLKSTHLLTAPNPFKDHNLPLITCGKIKAADGKTDLYYRLITPHNIDSTKKYPTVVYVYGGPHSQLITNSWQWGTRGWDLYMAQRGYVVFTLDNRGTSNRGIAFENVTHKQLGIEETSDQMEGVNFLKTLPYVDANRIGVHGWSYGGFMTTNLVLRHPETFKVGVAGGPVMDWKLYEIMYGERYMSSPQENPDGYKNTNMNLLAGNLQGKLLLIHCDNDPVVVWQHSLGFLKHAIQAGTYPDYFVYPGHKHNVAGPERVHLHEKITRYFDDNLK